MISAFLSGVARQGALALTLVAALVVLPVTACSPNDGRGSGPAGSGGLQGGDAGGTWSAGGASSMGGSALGGGTPGSSGSLSGGGRPEGGGPADAGEPPSPDAPASGLVVQVTGGVIEGTLKGSTRRFLGIPYAEPPVGQLRFAPPKPAAPWTGVRRTMEFGKACLQNQDATEDALKITGPGQDEDCLTLNVFAPDDLPANAPVMVFVHGGGFSTGGSWFYDGGALSQAGRVIVVTVNYRLNVLGFLAHPVLDAALGASSGNMGLRDQQLALRWVRDNVAKFGGDPDNVTLFGESAGSLSTCAHLFAKGSEGLAHRFIMQSVVCVGRALNLLTREVIEGTSRGLIDGLCGGKPDQVACLRALPARDLVGWAPSNPIAEVIGSLFAPNGPKRYPSFWPYIDGDLLPAPALELFRQGKFRPAPIIVGSNHQEFAMFQRLGFPKVENRLALQFVLGLIYPDIGAHVLDHYMPATDAEANQALVRATTDEFVRCPTRTFARLAAAGGANLYLYDFNVAPAGHTQELDYVFGFQGDHLISNLFAGVAPIPPPATAVDAIQGYWGNFARTGNPNGDGLVEWPAYERSRDPHMTLQESPMAGSHLSEADCDFWDEVRGAAP